MQNFKKILYYTDIDSGYPDGDFNSTSSSKTIFIAILSELNDRSKLSRKFELKSFNFYIRNERYYTYQKKIWNRL